MSDRIEEIRGRLAAATPGPWRADDEHGALPEGSPAWCVSKVSEVDGSWRYDIAYMESHNRRQNYVHDAQFMAAAPEDIAYLLAEIDRLREELADVRAELAEKRNRLDAFKEFEVVPHRWAIGGVEGVIHLNETPFLWESEVEDAPQFWAALTAVIPTRETDGGATDA